MSARSTAVALYGPIPILMIHYFEQLTSSNDEATLPHYREGDIIWAERQTAGRGQRGHTWQSNEGENLTFTALLEPTFLPPSEQFSLLQVVALAMVDMLSEDGIEAKQTGATADWMNIHNNAIRNAATTEPLTGYELGTIEAGKCVEQVLSLDITSSAWNRDNLKVMVIVSAKNAKGQFEVANVAICPMNDVVTYDYK